MHDYLPIWFASRLAGSQRGASAVEYALLIAGVAALIVLIVFAFGHALVDVFDGTCDSIAPNAGTTTC
jgi:pilus assembly protein Flp/PilA